MTGYTKAEGHAASLRQISKWIDEAGEGGEYDTDELRAAADYIDALVVALNFIVDGYMKPDVSHVDYRVMACQVAMNALGALSVVGGVKDA